MSVVINTNYAATLASSNLASSSTSLQRSLNRLASGSKIIAPQDDAAGLAVSMKLAATARRQNAISANLGNATSFLQTQDGALQVAGKVLSRVGELKTLYSDPTKNSADLANYQAEFAELQSQLTSLGNEKFNGTALFGSSTLSVSATADPGGSTIAVGGAAIMGTPAASTNFSFSGLGTASLSPTGAGTLTVASGGLFLDDGNGNSAVLNGAGAFATYDGAGNWTFGGGASSSGSFTGSNITVAGSATSPAGAFVGNGTFVPSGGNSDVSSASTATNLGSLNLATVTGAIQEIATLRATNGAQQSRLQFADEVVRVNKANIEAANSRITDVDVAEESTSLARYNILVQSGTAMLTQANQSAQMALKLLG